LLLLVLLLVAVLGPTRCHALSLVGSWQNSDPHSLSPAVYGCGSCYGYYSNCCADS